MLSPCSSDLSLYINVLQHSSWGTLCSILTSTKPIAMEWHGVGNVAIGGAGGSTTPKHLAC